MSGYTVTITPSGGQAGPQTTIYVDTTSGAARVTEITTKAADGNGLAPQQMPAIDLAGLVAALAPGAVSAIETGVEAPAVTAGRATRGRRGRGAAKAAKAAKAAPAKSAGRGRRRKAAGEEPKAGRAYRRMPEQDQVVAAWRQSGSASAVAEHFGVPRHTATGWLRRLRTMGAIES
jgi:hypothetical protein